MADMLDMKHVGTGIADDWPSHDWMPDTLGTCQRWLSQIASHVNSCKFLHAQHSPGSLTHLDRAAEADAAVTACHDDAHPIEVKLALHGPSISFQSILRIM